MEIQTPLYKAFLIKRYSKVLADACLETGELVTAYCSNTTKMKTLTESKTEVYLSYLPKENRHLHLTWELASVNGSLVGVNMGRQTELITEAILNGTVYELGGYEKVERIKPTSPSSDLDLQLIPAENSGYPVCKVAIAPVYLKNGVDLLYPDAVAVENHHVLNQLSQALYAGERTVLVLLAQRIDCLGVRAQWTADAAYLTALKDLYDKGLEIICCGCSVSQQGIWVTARLPFSF